MFSADQASERGLVEALLLRDPLRAIVPLKMLHAYGDVIACRYAERADGGAALLLLPTARSAWDTAHYPDAELVVLSVADSVSAAKSLLQALPAGRYVFKVAGDPARAALEDCLAVRRTTAFLSFTTVTGARYAPDPGVRCTASPDAQQLAIFAEHGHDPGELAHLCATGEAFVLLAGSGDFAGACCFATCIFPGIWEIGGLYTRPEVRRGGLARRLVETGLAILAERGMRPRYQVREDNLASIRLAESVGLGRFVTVEHFVSR